LEGLQKVFAGHCYFRGISGRDRFKVTNLPTRKATSAFKMPDKVAHYAVVFKVADFVSKVTDSFKLRESGHSDLQCLGYIYYYLIGYNLSRKK
jgi:hypothetical protein